MRPDEVKALAVAIVDELEKRAKIKQRRGRPCGMGNKMPECMLGRARPNGMHL